MSSVACDINARACIIYVELIIDNVVSVADVSRCQSVIDLKLLTYM